MTSNKLPPRDVGPMTSHSLLIRIKDSGDSDAWRIFESVYGPVIRAYCRRRGFQPSDIDDITQDVLAAVARSIKTFEYCPERGLFRCWLATVTANKLRNFVARSGYHDAEISNVIERLEKHPESDAQWSSVFLQEVLQAACDRIRPTVEEKTWHCFQASWLNDRKPIEIADQLDIPVHTVYVNKSRVLKRLEQEFLMLADDLPSSGLNATG